MGCWGFGSVHANAMAYCPWSPSDAGLVLRLHHEKVRPSGPDTLLSLHHWPVSQPTLAPRATALTRAALREYAASSWPWHRCRLSANNRTTIGALAASLPGRFIGNALGHRQGVRGVLLCARKIGHINPAANSGRCLGNVHAATNCAPQNHRIGTQFVEVRGRASTWLGPGGRCCSNLSFELFFALFLGSDFCVDLCVFALSFFGLYTC